MSGSGAGGVDGVSSGTLSAGTETASASTPTMPDKPSGTATSPSKSSRMKSMVVFSPAKRGRKKMTGSRQIVG
jgi:hypothetical protein